MLHSYPLFEYLSDVRPPAPGSNERDLYMRYREGIPPDQVQASVSEPMLLATAVFALMIGIGFVVFGRYGRQRWLVAWGGMTVVVTGVYLGAALLGYH